MYPTLAVCRAQEARQRDIAAASSLANVKGVAMLAAIAWAKEAAAAERREERRALRAQSLLHAAPPLEERPFSENTNRSYADGPG